MNTNRPVYIIGFMMALAAVFGATITGVYLSQAKTVERNRSILRARALIQVFALGDVETLTDDEIASLVATRIDSGEQRTDPRTGWTFPLLKAFADDDHTQLKALGFEFRGLGYWAPIAGILAVTPDMTRTSGLVILKHSETPGLGGRITEPIFRDQFHAGLNIAQPATKNSAILHLTKEAPEVPGTRALQGITGATQTCTAMQVMLNEHIARFHRAMQPAVADSATTTLAREHRP